MTDRADGDLAVAVADKDLRAQIAPGAWTWLHQVHSDRVVAVSHPGAYSGAVADAAVSSAAGVTLAIQVADCIPIALVSDRGVVGAAHAGWRGLANGVVESTWRAMTQIDPSVQAAAATAVVGPCICALCYEFGEPELTQLANQFGVRARSRTADGQPALNLHEAMAFELNRLGIGTTMWADECTSCNPVRYWSWRARKEAGRQAMIVEISRPDHDAGPNQATRSEHRAGRAS